MTKYRTVTRTLPDGTRVSETTEVPPELPSGCGGLILIVIAGAALGSLPAEVRGQLPLMQVCAEGAVARKMVGTWAAPTASTTIVLGSEVSQSKSVKRFESKLIRDTSVLQYSCSGARLVWCEGESCSGKRLPIEGDGVNGPVERAINWVGAKVFGRGQ